jgi:hypothetical protein
VRLIVFEAAALEKTKSVRYMELGYVRLLGKRISCMSNPDTARDCEQAENKFHVKKSSCRSNCH